MGNLQNLREKISTQILQIYADSKFDFAFFFLIIAKYISLAPIAVKILISRGSAYKIVTNSGTGVLKKPNASAPK
jgi:hypothetical protein